MVGSLTIGAIMAFVNYLTATMFPMMMIGMMAGQISAASASSERILEVLDSRPDVQERPGAVELAPMRGHVTFEDVTFSYHGATGEPVLQHVTLEAHPGERVAILGATGAGKSSLVSLIPRFYDVSSGGWPSTAWMCGI
jgi:ATP-binding cassette subfamily B protein